MSATSSHAIGRAILPIRRGKPIVDPVTGQSLGYEMEWVSSPLASA